MRRGYCRTRVRLLGWPAAAVAPGPGRRARSCTALVARPAACYAQRMARASLTITGHTADALRAAKPALSYATGHTLTVDGCVAYLLRYWLQTHPVGQAQDVSPGTPLEGYAPRPPAETPARG